MEGTEELIPAVDTNSKTLTPAVMVNSGATDLLASPKPSTQTGDLFQGSAENSSFPVSDLLSNTSDQVQDNTGSSKVSELNENINEIYSNRKLSDGDETDSLDEIPENEENLEKDQGVSKPTCVTDAPSTDSSCNLANDSLEMERCDNNEDNSETEDNIDRLLNTGEQSQETVKSDSSHEEMESVQDATDFSAEEWEVLDEVSSHSSEGERMSEIMNETLNDEEEPEEEKEEGQIEEDLADNKSDDSNSPDDKKRRLKEDCTDEDGSQWKRLRLDGNTFADDDLPLDKEPGECESGKEEDDDDAKTDDGGEDRDVQWNSLRLSDDEEETGGGKDALESIDEPEKAEKCEGDESDKKDDVHSEGEQAEDEKQDVEMKDDKDEVENMEETNSDKVEKEDGEDKKDLEAEQDVKDALEKSTESVEDDIIIEEVRSMGNGKVEDEESKKGAKGSEVRGSPALSLKELLQTDLPNKVNGTPTKASGDNSEDKDEMEIIVIPESDIADETNLLKADKKELECGNLDAIPDGDKTAKTIVLTSKALEELLKKAVRDYLLKGGKTEMKLLKQKCEVLEKSLERWRRRAMQLQKQINDLLQDQKDGVIKPSIRQVPMRSVGVNVEISPIQRGPFMPTSKVLTTTKPQTIQSKDHQIPRYPEILPKATSSTPSLTVTAVPAKTKIAPASGSVLVSALKPGILSRTEAKSQAGQLNRPPVPLQLVANSAATGVPIAFASGKSSTVTSTAGTTTSTQIVKVIDLTKEDDDATSKVNVVQQKITNSSTTVVGQNVVMSTPMSGISIPTTINSIPVPIMTSLPPTLQVIRPSNPTTTSVSTVTQKVRLQNSVTVHPISQGQQVTYLLPRAPSSTVTVIPRMSGTVNNLTITSPSPRAGSLPRQPLQTIYLQKVPLQAHQVAVPVSQVTTLHTDSLGNIKGLAPGKAVSITSTPAPPPLQISVTNANRPSTSISIVNQSSDAVLGTQRAVLPQQQTSTSSASKHPAPLPTQPIYPNSTLMKSLPPKPTLKLSRVNNGIVLSWNMALNPSHAEISMYQLYAYQETSGTPTSNLWRKIGDVRALPLPMACTLTQFLEGHKYHFAVRALDVHNRLGSFSEPMSIVLPASSSSTSHK